jgi:hypothetical protein
LVKIFSPTPRKNEGEAAAMEAESTNNALPQIGSATPIDSGIEMIFPKVNESSSSWIRKRERVFLPSIMKL